MVIFVTTCSGASASVMLGDVRGLKGRPQWLVFAVDVRWQGFLGSRLGRKVPGSPAPGPGG